MHNSQPARLLLILCFSIATTGILAAGDPVTLIPKQIDLSSTKIDDTWKSWNGICDFGGTLSLRERITAIVAADNGLWIGTSIGRLLTRSNDEWTSHGTLTGLQITGIAVDGSDKVWLSTSDGIRQLDRSNDSSWKVTEFVTYYKGQLSFVSGGYLPGDDAVRRWGYVDDIYIPLEEKSYSPFVISNAHGLFCWGGYGDVWHHFMPHYWGANSDWLDTQEIVPHRRPTCMVEDHEGNLWIGTEWDGIVRLNSHGRKYSDRKPIDNKKDGTEFSFFTSKEIGFEFDRVTDLAVSDRQGIWAVLSSRKSGSHIGHFNGDSWTTLSLDEKLSPVSIVETKPGEVLVGVRGPYQGEGISKVTWDSQQVEQSLGGKDEIFDIIKLPDGRVFAASWWGLYEASTP